jgi:hypothetical protein
VRWRREVIRLARRTATREVLVRLRGEPTVLDEEFRVDPDWRRVEDGSAARLDPRTTIDVAEPVGRWQGVDPRVANEGWRSPWKAVGLGMWMTAVGVSGWLGWRRGRGPLAALRDDEGRWW